MSLSFSFFSQMSPIGGTNSQIFLQNSIQNKSIQINSTHNPIQSQTSSATETQVTQNHSQAIANQRESIETHVQHIQTINRHVESTQSIGTHIQHTNLAHVSDQCPLITKQTASHSWTLGANGKNIARNQTMHMALHNFHKQQFQWKQMQCTTCHEILPTRYRTTRPIHV